MSREDVYDIEIAPLMTRIIEVCKAYDIPVLATFELDDDRSAQERPEFACTTAIVPKDASSRLVVAMQIITEGFSALTVRTAGRIW